MNHKMSHSLYTLLVSVSDTTWRLLLKLFVAASAEEEQITKRLLACAVSILMTDECI